jgi:hypothetical protein
VKTKPGYLLAVALIVSFGTHSKAADEKSPATAKVAETFKQFAAAVKEDKYEDAAKWIAEPADKVWVSFAAVRASAAKYDAALEEKFGKSNEPGLQDDIAKKGFLADHFYETQGEIQEVKDVGKDRVHVRVWTKRPDWQKQTETALYERTFTAVKSGDQWKFQLHTFGGTPVLKKVKRKTLDGKEVEVYAGHEPKVVTDQKTWVELKPISYDGREEDLKQEAEMWAKAAVALKSQTELIQKGTYKTRKEALEGLQKAFPKS